MKTALMMVTISALFLGGCATTGSSDAFRSDGLPDEKYCVGGGFKMNYVTNTFGHVYLVDLNSKKILETAYVSKGDAYTFAFNPDDDAVHLKLKKMGIDPVNMKLGLYFVPIHKKQ
ncbi:MAG: hypothetical protein ABFR90_08760 [Planctomycetota bacterium]